MAYQGISTGTGPNTGSGDSLLDGAVKINSNFQEIYSTLGVFDSKFQEIYSALGDGNTINFNQTTTITAGNGLTGGGDLSANRTINVGAGTGIDVAEDSISINPSYRFPVGGIIMWSGSVASIPSGWALCDGNNGTPDLRNKFIVGAESDSENTTYPNVGPGATGGSADAIVVTHNHGVGTLSGSLSGSTDIDGSHSHEITTYAVDPELSNIGLVKNQTVDDNDTGLVNTSTHDGHTHNLSNVTVSFSGNTGDEGSSGTNANLPPYYALAYIMRTA